MDGLSGKLNEVARVVAEAIAEVERDLPNCGDRLKLREAVDRASLRRGVKFVPTDELISEMIRKPIDT